MRGHVDLETLAAFRAELLPRRKAARVRRHLARCTQCAGLDAQLADLPALLADVPAPPMPDALTARITAAIAEEAAARSAGVPAAAAQAVADGDAAPAQPGDATDGARGRRTRRPTRTPSPGRSRLALRIATAAAVVVVIVGGGIGVSRLLSGSSPTGASGSAAAPAERTAPHNALQGPNQNGASGSGGNGAARSGSKEHLRASGAAGYPVVTSGTNYRPGQLGAQVKAVLARFPSVAPVPRASGTSSSLRLGGLDSCLTRVAGAQRLRLVDLARYDGRPATVIVLPAGPNTLRVLVAGPRCSATEMDLVASTTLHGTG